MRKTAKKYRPAIKNCGGRKRGKGSCGSWAGASKGQATIKITA